MRVVAEDSWSWLAGDAPGDVPRPSRCDEALTETCQFDIYVASDRRPRSIELIVFTVEGEAQLVDHGAVLLNGRMVDGTSSTHRFDVPGKQPLRITASFDPIVDPQAAAMSFIEIRMEDPAPTDEYIVATSGPELYFADKCCALHSVRVVDPDDHETFDEPVEASLGFEVTLFTHRTSSRVRSTSPID